MSLVCLGFSHSNVPVAVREQLYFDGDRLATANNWIASRKLQSTGLTELVVLSTCNRTELYASMDSELPFDAADRSNCELVQLLADCCGVDSNNLLRFANWHSGDEVFRHLSRVASGLESQALGEPQILGQVRDALESAVISRTAGPELTQLFKRSVKAGRRARNETQINQHSQNFPTIAVNLASEELTTLAGKNIALLGAGEMSRRLLQVLNKKRVSELKIINRNLEPAQRLAARYGCQAFAIEQLYTALVDIDLLFTSTSSTNCIVTRPMVEDLMQCRPERELVILDIAVPRDVEPSVEQIAGVSRFDIDDLKIVANEARELREQQVPLVESIVEEELVSFTGSMSGKKQDRVFSQNAA